MVGPQNATRCTDNHARVGRRSLAHPWCSRALAPARTKPKAPRTRRSPQPRTPLVFARRAPRVGAIRPRGGNAHPSGAARLRPLALRRPRSGRPHARPHTHASHSHATPCQDCPATHAHTLCRHGTHCVRLRHPLTLRQTPQRWQSHRRGARCVDLYLWLARYWPISCITPGILARLPS